MSNGDQVKLGHLTFFERELWNSALAEKEFQTILHPYPFSVVLSLYPFELALWLQLGSSIGFFDSLQAATFLSHQDSTLQSQWNNLLKPGESLLPQLPEFIVNDRGSLKTAIDVFLKSSSETDSSGQSLFQMHLLMNSELMGDVEAVFFLEALNWAPEEVWSRIINRDLWHGSLAGLGRGLSAVLAFFEASAFASANILDCPDSEALSENFLLDQRLQELQRARLGAGNVNTAKRYFQLAGTLLADSTIATTQGEIDFYRAAFVQIESLLGAWISLGPNHQKVCWEAFTAELERSAERRLGQRHFNV
jgi:hypothetical protein